jgi:hypothetical protein
MSTKATSAEYKIILKNYHDQIKPYHQTYSVESLVLEKLYLQIL